ncbi:MAG: glycerol-3-phosphate 1-O-acyltransferase PlsY [Methylococcales bacterium]|nr:glycerol-3-phosphate 1-O-acyltransferase PlsY [Methylococcales bacterium]
MEHGLFIVAAYLIGSLSSAIIVCKIMGLPDPREQGSGNPGATNVLRLGGKKAAGITLLGDLVKGLVPVFLVHLYGVPDSTLALAGLAAFFGHLYPVFFGFRGGKGMATSVGILMGFNWVLGFAVMGTWTLIYKVGRISSLAAVLASILAPLYAWWWLANLPLTLATLVMTVVVLWRHRSNIKRLLDGTET